MQKGATEGKEVTPRSSRLSTHASLCNSNVLPPLHASKTTAASPAMPKPLGRRQSMVESTVKNNIPRCYKTKNTMPRSLSLNKPSLFTCYHSCVYFISASIALKNCKRIEKLDDPIGPVKEILKLCPTETFVSLYKLPNFDSPEDFLQKVATVGGKRKKGGVVDVEAASSIRHAYDLHSILNGQGAGDCWSAPLPLPHSPKQLTCWSVGVLHSLYS